MARLSGAFSVVLLTCTAVGAVGTVAVAQQQSAAVAERPSWSSSAQATLRFSGS